MATYDIKNTPQNLTLNDFRSNANKGKGFAKSSRFLFNIAQSLSFMSNAKNAPNVVKGVPEANFKNELTFLCEATEFPMRGFMTTDIRYYGPNFKVPYQTQYEDLNLTFLCRDDFIEREFFDTWMQYINPLSTYDFNYRDEYTTKLELFQLSDIQGSTMAADGTTPMQKATYKFSFYGAYPILVAAQPVTWADDNFHRLTVSFTYKWWQRDEIDIKKTADYEMVSGATNITNGGTVLPYFKDPIGVRRADTQSSNPLTDLGNYFNNNVQQSNQIERDYYSDPSNVWNVGN